MSASPTQAVYAAERAFEEAWKAKRSLAGLNTRFGDWHEVRPFVEAAVQRWNAHVGQTAAVPSVRARKGSLRAHYEPETATIALPTFAKGGAWALTAATVLHELAHHLTGGDQHGRRFRDAHVLLYQALGWVKVANLLAEAHARYVTGEGQADGHIEKVTKLLNHASRASTEAERDAFLARAQALAATHSIDLALARANGRAGGGERSNALVSRDTSLMYAGGPGLRNLLVRLAFDLARAQGISATVAGSNRHLTFYGYEEDVTAVETLFAHLAPMMLADSDEYLRSEAHRASTVNGRSARIVFVRAWSRTVEERLRAAREQAEQESVAREAAQTLREEGREVAPSSTSTALALQAKEIEVADYVRAEFRRQGVRGSWGGARASQWSSSASSAGQRAGARVALSARKALTGYSRPHGG